MSRTISAKDVMEGDYLPSEHSAVAEVRDLSIRGKIMLILTNEETLVLRCDDEIEVL